MIDGPEASYPTFPLGNIGLSLWSQGAIGTGCRIRTHIARFKVSRPAVERTRYEMVRPGRFELPFHRLKGGVPRPLEDGRMGIGAGSENRTRVLSLEGTRSTIELHPHCKV